MEYKNYEVKNISGLHEWHEYIVAICLWKIKIKCIKKYKTNPLKENTIIQI